MLIEMLMNKDDKSMEEKFNQLNNLQIKELLNEIQEKRDKYKEDKIVVETNINTLTENRNNILKTLNDEYGLATIQDAEKKIDELNTDVIKALQEFVEAQNELSI